MNYFTQIFLTINKSYNSIRYEAISEKHRCFGVVFLYTFRNKGVGI